MARAWDIQIAGASLFFIPIQTRVPLKFGTETLTSVTCARVRLTVRNSSGEIDHGWGETPLSVQWVWPGKLSYETRHSAMQ
ncbi:MAG: transrane prediction, partial [Verrucomicrobiales bacterium]|nr:transrane prediction [Verrucomicrobiales bacterium]